MSYEKQTWQTGDIITAVKLNHMEDGIANPGYTVETKAVAVVPEQSVTTAVQGSQPFAMGGLVLAEGVTSLDDVSDPLTITFQGQEYVCEANAVNGGKYYGGFTETGLDFSQYPFVLAFESSNDVVAGGLMTESAGTYTIKAEGVSETITVTDDFTKAVNKVTSIGIPAYTLDNVGAVLTVATDYKTVDTIPEQSVTILAGTSRANLSDVSGPSNTFTLYINGEQAQYTIYNAYQYSNFAFKIDMSASPATLIYGIITGKDDSSMKFEENNADEDTTFTIRGTGDVEVPVLKWVKSGDSSSDDEQSISITPDDGLNKG